MPTDYYGTPLFAERVIAADVILIGAIGKLIAIESLPNDPLRVFGKFEIRVESVWKGQPDAVLELRVLGKQEGDRFVGIVDLLEGERYLLMLARDTAPPELAIWYVPYFSAVYPVTVEGQVQLPQEILDPRTLEIASLDAESKAALETIQKVVNTLLQEREEEQRRFRELLPDELLTQPYPPLEEMPDAGHNAATGGTPPNDIDSDRTSRT